MNKTSVSLGLLVLCCLAQAAEVSHGSRITEVTVFEDRAFVHRTQTVSLAAGAQSVAFPGVTPLADMDSLRVQLSNRSGLTLMGIRHDNRYTLKSQNPELEKLRKEERALEDARQEIVDRVTLLNHENDDLKELSDHYHESFAINLHQNTWTKAQFRDFVAFLLQQANKLNAAWYKHYRDYLDLDRRLEMTRAKIAALSSATDRETRTVLVDLLVDAATSVTVDVQYLVKNVGWSPAYDLRVDRTEGGPEGKAVLALNAFVWQRTGEDWDRVRLRLSNEHTELRPEAPTIARYVLSYSEEKKVTTKIGGRRDDVTRLGGKTPPPEEKEKEGGKEENALAKTFIIPDPQTVKSRAVRTRIAIEQRALPYREHLELVAGQFPHVFRKGELVNAFPYDLGAGPMNLFYQGTFLEQTHLAPVARGSRFGINAGLDPDVKVVREIDDKEKAPGLLGGKRQMVRVYRTKLENFSAKVKKIKLLDQIPVSELAAVKVSMESNLGKGEQEDDTEGWYFWDVSLPSRAKKISEMKVSVLVPTDVSFNW